MATVPLNTIHATSIRGADITKLFKDGLRGADLHCHFEGILNVQSLEEVAASLDADKLLTKETWAYITATATNPAMNWQNFSARLVGRWMRVLCIAALNKHGISIEKTMKACISKALVQLHDQGIGLAEIMVSVNTLSKEGNFGVMTVPANCAKEERELITVWNATLHEQHAPSIYELLSWFRDVIVTDGRLVPAGHRGEMGRQTEVGIKFMIRREKDSHFYNDSPNLMSEVAFIERLHRERLIVGVDVAGDEYVEQGAISNFKALLMAMRTANIPFSVHAGEVGAQSPAAEQSYRNLEQSLRLGARRIGHAVRLFDATPPMSRLLSEILRSDVILEVNVTSNVWTGTIDERSISKHPIVQALNGEHPLFREHPSDLPLLREHVVICDDNPAVISPREPSLAHEYALVAGATNCLGYGSLKSMLAHQYEIAAKSTLWHSS